MAAIPRDQVVLIQLSAAFGQGAGTLFVSEDAVVAALDHFTPVLPRLAAEWAEKGLQVLEYARTIGRTAGWLAIERGDDAISEADFREGLKRVRGLNPRLFGPCPFLHVSGPESRR